MLTSDVALLHDAKYLDIVVDFSKNPKALDHAFQHAWYKLTTRDMGPHRRSCIHWNFLLHLYQTRAIPWLFRCMGPWVPPPQPWQYSLTHQSKPGTLPDFEAVRKDILKAINSK